MLIYWLQLHLIVPHRREQVSAVVDKPAQRLFLQSELDDQYDKLTVERTS